MPQLVHYDRVEDVSAKHFQGLLARRRPRAVILGGGSPCQGNSVLNKSRRGLSDDRSLQPAQLKRLKAEFEELPEMQDVVLILFLENVASMPADVLSVYCQWLDSMPGNPRIWDGSLGEDSTGWHPRRGASPLTLDCRLGGSVCLPPLVSQNIDSWDPNQFRGKCLGSRVLHLFLTHRMLWQPKGKEQCIRLLGNFVTPQTGCIKSPQQQLNGSNQMLGDFHRGLTKRNVWCGMARPGALLARMSVVKSWGCPRTCSHLWRGPRRDAPRPATPWWVMVSTFHLLSFYCALYLRS